MVNVMIDIETLGTSTDAVILSIGATKFNADEIIDTFAVAIDPSSCQQYGMKIDAGTVMWWMHPDRAAARQELLADEKVDIFSALDGFAQWFGDKSLPTWGNGASFDNVLVRAAFAKVNLPCPWAFWDDRCYRTMKNMYPESVMIREGTHHAALDDAVYQTKHLQLIWGAMAR